MNREEIAVALTTSFRSSLIAPFSTPELRAAFEQLKDFVRVNATAGEIESRACARQDYIVGTDIARHFEDG